MTGVVLQGEGISFISNQTGGSGLYIYVPPLRTEIGWPSRTLGHWVSILVTSMTCMEYGGPVFVPGHHMGTA